MSLTHQDFHWGDGPRGGSHTSQILQNRPATSIGTIREISYAATKAGKPEVWEHRFSVVNGRRPHLLAASSKGRYQIGRAPSSVVTLGPVVDVVLGNGRRMLLPFYYAVTDRDGRGIWLASRYRPEAQIEFREHGNPRVTRRGIEG